jgi:uncharacterized membrane protein HdeD (DUF308 family)
MHYLFEKIWKRFGRTPLGRFVAGFLIGAVAGLSASLSVSHDGITAAISSGATALIGGVAALFLESRDRRRSTTSEWRQRVESTTSEILGVYPEVPPVIAKEAATAAEEKRLTPLAWVGMVVGILCLLCGLLMFIVKVVNLFRQ